MELKFESEGGYVDLAVGSGATTTLSVFDAEPAQIRVAIDSRNSNGEVGLGVGLDTDQARRLGEYLLALATVIAEEETPDEK